MNVKTYDPHDREVPTHDATRASGIRPDATASNGPANGPIDARSAPDSWAAMDHTGIVDAEGQEAASTSQRHDAPPRREPEPDQGEFLRRATSVELRALAEYDPLTHGPSDVPGKAQRDAWRRGVAKGVDANLGNEVMGKLARQQLQQRQARARPDGGHRASQPVGRPRMVLGGLALILVLWLLTK